VLQSLASSQAELQACNFPPSDSLLPPAQPCTSSFLLFCDPHETRRSSFWSPFLDSSIPPMPFPTSHPASTTIAMDDGCVDCGGAAATRASHCAAGDPKGAHLCDDQGHGNRSKPAIRSSLQKCSGCRPEAAGMTGPRRAIPDPDSVPVPLRRDAGPSRRFLLLDDFL
jgi:hypothetical protein